MQPREPEAAALPSVDTPSAETAEAGGTTVSPATADDAGPAGSAASTREEGTVGTPAERSATAASGEAVEPTGTAATGADTASHPAAPPRRLPRALTVVLATVGLLAVTAGSAAVTVAVGRPGPGGPVAQADRAATVSPSPAASLSPSATNPAPPSPTASPTPRSTVTGTVSNGNHTGDLRFFLLSTPGDAEVYGDADGTALSLAQLAKGFGNPAETKGILRDYGFRSAAYRTYRTKDGAAEVTIRLIRFGSADKARWFAEGMSMGGTAFAVPEVSGARGFLVEPDYKGGTGSLIGLFHQGDVEVQIAVDVKGSPHKATLTKLMKQQYKRLRTGR